MSSEAFTDKVDFQDQVLSTAFLLGGGEGDLRLMKQTREGSQCPGSSSSPEGKVGNSLQMPTVSWLHLIFCHIMK